jgi:molybdopterin molybdotransferase
MSELFTVLPPGEAFATFGRDCSPVERSETVPLEAALGRVLFGDVRAAETLPAFARSTMDGYAVRAADTHGASEGSPAYLRLIDDVPTGVVPRRRVGVREAVRTHTGAMLPPGADAVVMVEDTNLHPATGAGQAEVEVLASAPPGDNVLAIGEDVVAGNVALRAGRRLRAADVGGLAALGVTRVTVRGRPRIAILSTGDEVVSAGATPGPAQVRDVNATTVAAVVTQAGGVPVPCGIAADDAAQIERALRAALENADAVVLSAGSSVSVRDLTAQVVARLGPPGVLVHGIAIKPGEADGARDLRRHADRRVAGKPGERARRGVADRAAAGAPARRRARRSGRTRR